MIVLEIAIGVFLGRLIWDGVRYLDKRYRGR